MTSSLWGQQNPNGRFPIGSLPDPYLMLIRDPLVQGDLRLSGEQQRAVAAFTDQQDAKLWTMRSQPADKAATTFQELTTAARARMDQLLSQQQRLRLEQIRFRVAGVKALQRDEVARRLELSDEQRAEIRRILEQHEAANEESRPSNDGEQPTDRRTDDGAPANDPRTRIWELLSPDQQARVREMFGAPIDLSRLGYVKFKAPELDGRNGWLNSEPLTMAQLRGKVVALHFWAFG